MPNNKIAIISVSQTLTQAVNTVLQQGGKSYPVYEATLDQAVSIAKRCMENGIEVFVSRGRTATYLREHLPTTVVDIGSSYFSYANAINDLRRRGIYRIAVLGFSDQFHHVAERYKDIFGPNVVFRSFQWRGKTDETLQEEFAEALRGMKAEGIKAVIGNHSIRRVADSLGFVSAIHYPDTDMIEMALIEAEYTARSLTAYEEKSQTISAFLSAVSEILIKVDENGCITEFNPAAQSFFHLSSERSTTVTEMIPSVNWNAFREHPVELHEKVHQYDGQNIVMDIVPIFISSVFSGAVVSAQKVAQIQKLEQKLRSAITQKGLVAKHSFSDIIGNSPSIRTTIDRAKRIAWASGTVLLTGETGTGKEVFAQSIHNASRRANGPFVAINCAALSPSVLESELFGYVRGAFTGALSEGKTGIFELAHMGTIFLDEIGELPFDIQAKLLRVVQEKEIVRIGDNKVIPVDVRIIAATNRDLQEEVDKHRFRSDLYYRLSVLTLHLPPLTQRLEDIPLLMQRFLSQESPNKTLTPAAVELLKKMPWPGNIRQLRNEAERLAVFSDTDVIDAADIAFSGDRSFPNPAEPPRSQADMAMRERILSALSSAKGSHAAAAEQLGISTVTLWRWIKRVRETDPGFLKK